MLFGDGGLDISKFVGIGVIEFTIAIVDSWRER